MGQRLLWAQSLKEESIPSRDGEEGIGQQENLQLDSLYNRPEARRGPTLLKDTQGSRTSILCVSPDANITNANVNGHHSGTRAPVTPKSGFPHLENGCRAEGPPHRMCK